MLSMWWQWWYTATAFKHIICKTVIQWKLNSEKDIIIFFSVLSLDILPTTKTKLLMFYLNQTVISSLQLSSTQEKIYAKCSHKTHTHMYKRDTVNQRFSLIFNQQLERSLRNSQKPICSDLPPSHRPSKFYHGRALVIVWTRCRTTAATNSPARLALSVSSDGKETRRMSRASSWMKWAESKRNLPKARS